MVCAVVSQAGPGLYEVVLPQVIDATTCPYLLHTFGDFDAAALGVTAGSILYVYSWGVAAVLLMWGLGVAVGAALRVISKA